MATRDEFVKLIDQALAVSERDGESVFLSDDESGVWQEYNDADEYVPELLIEVSPNGKISLITNGPTTLEDAKKKHGIES